MKIVKNIFLIIIMLSPLQLIFAQPDQSFVYQAVLRNPDGTPVVDNDLALEISLLAGDPAGEVVFSEVHHVDTDHTGLVSVQVGSINSLQEVNWNDGVLYLEIRVNDIVNSITELLSVPFALHAKTSSDAFSGDYADLCNLPDMNNFIYLEEVHEGDMFYFTGEEWKRVPYIADSLALTVLNGIPQWTFIDDVPENSVADIDGNIYKTVTIGTQVWMAENLRTTRYRNGDIIPNRLTANEWVNTSSGAFTVYPHTGGIYDDDIDGIDSDEEMAETYGLLYNWYAVEDYRGLCPEGWKVPSDMEWSILTNYIISEHEEIYQGNVGNVLRSCRQINSPLGGNCDTDVHPRWEEHFEYYGTDDYGFNALPAGGRGSEAEYNNLGFVASYWTESQLSEEYYFNRVIVFDAGNVFDGYGDPRVGNSIRCVKITNE